MNLDAPEIHGLLLAISDTDILTCLGVVPGEPVRPRLKRLAVEIHDIARSEAKPQLVWRTGTSEAVASAFSPSRRMTRYLEKPESAAIVAATAGKRMEARISSESDPMKAYVLGAAATAIARATLVQARRMLHRRFPAAKVADSLSPGTDGLPFRLQAEFFNLLPMSSIGISLDRESLLMSPPASVTAIIGWGREVEKEVPIEECGELNPNCESCSSNSCQIRIKPFESRRESA